VNSIILIAVVCGATFGFMFFMRRNMNQKYAHMKAGQLAQRLGMQLVEGNPEFNLVTQSVQPSVQNQSSAKGFLGQIAATSVGGTLGEFKLRMAGQPYGVNAELSLYCRQDYEPGFTENVTTTWSDLRLTVHTRAPVAPFDLRLRNEHTGLETRRDDEPRMPPQPFGDAVLDGKLVLETPDPRIPRAIAGVLAPLAHNVYVHVVGSGTQISFVMTPSSVNAAAMNLEQVLHVLASIAAIFEGRPVPGALAA
jgi:hypothetical protein